MNSRQLKARRRDLGAWDPTIPSEANAYNRSGKPQIEAGAHAHPTDEPTIVDLFSGCGGISQGFKNAGLKTVLAVDIHEPSIETFRLNHPEATTILGDIRKVDNASVIDALGGVKPTAVAGGAPCQWFSLCNRKQFDDDPRNRLFLQYMRIVELLRPKFVMFENVQNIRSVANGKYARLIERHFEDLGYTVASGPVNATEFGVPQKRVRWIVFGMLNAASNTPWPIGDRRGMPPLTVRDAIGDLPRLGNDDSVEQYDRQPTSAFQMDMRRGAVALLNHTSPHHPSTTVRRIARTKQGEPMYESFRQRIRLSWDTPSPTQVSGGIRPQFQFGHPDQPRGLSVRERCRIQSFPDTYEILGGTVQGRVQTGNAVPPLVAEAFGRLVMSLITGEERIASIRGVTQIAFPLVAAG